jgi:hypothetical protein
MLPMRYTLRLGVSSYMMGAEPRLTFIWAVSLCSLRSAYIVYLWSRNFSRRHAQDLVGPSEITLSSASRSTK